MASNRMQLNALRAFEMAARLKSMSAAASELGVTHGAISRHIKALEAEFGLLLLKRLPHSVEPTPEGAQLAATLADAFNLINLGVSRVRSAPVTLSCSATIMMYWLIPRLADFKQANPDIDLRLNVSHGDINLGRDEISVAIRNSMYQPADDMIVRRLIAEEIGPVCHPGYAGKLGLCSPEDFGRGRILTSFSRPKAWAEWATAINKPQLAFIGHEGYEHFYLVIQAAACGLGVAMAPRILVDGEIEAGRLVAPCGFAPGPHSLNLWIAPHLRARKDVRKVIVWLDAKMRKAASRAPAAAPSQTAIITAPQPS